VRYGATEGYMRKKYLTIISEYQGFTEVNPTLYRDTVLTLTWDYFGFEKNLYKPDGYSDGIYLWNPRSWDKDNVKFSFEELVRCGTQYVIYPIFNPDTYKIWVQGNYVGKSYTSSYTNPTGGQVTYYTRYINNPGISINLAVSGITHPNGEYLY
jgi:hypothetical protein